MKTRNFLALDLGAESGRAILGRIAGERLELNEVHRFSNHPVHVGNRYYWNPLSLFAEMKNGLAIAETSYNISLDAIGIDSWGVDFALLDKNDALLDNPRNYRDPRTDGFPQKAFEEVPRSDIFAQTGIQFLNINTLYQLLSMRGSACLDTANTMLMMADLFNFYFTGSKTTEFSNATTTQMFNPSTGTWAYDLLNRFQLPTSFLPVIVEPGTKIGTLRGSIQNELNSTNIPFIAPATHDTGSAVAAIPSQKDPRDLIYISSGTWSLMGVQIEKPILTHQALEHNFTNEGGVGHTFRFLKNIMGLWIVQECRRTWNKTGATFDYDQLINAAENATPFAALFDPDDQRFLPPGNMPERLKKYWIESEQKVVDSPGGIIRSTLESLSLKYRYTSESIERILQRHFDVIHIVGGGIQNELLCQFTANATRKTVIAGPVEATAIGNIMVQAMGVNEVSNIDQARQIIHNSFIPNIYTPIESEIWDSAYEKFVSLI
ncbi:MAG: rhamnulokinase family protein [Candidatus Latescibacterota bacterium]|nr:rhamnulokinase family protein [Candidatus Latescibacterota bacterium]